MTSRSRPLARGLASNGGAAAADGDHSALNEAGCIGAREENRVGDLLWRGHPAGPRSSSELIQRVAHDRCALSACGAGGYGVDPNPAGADSTAQALVRRLM